MCQWFNPFFGENAEQLSIGPGRIGQRPKQIKDGTDTKLDPRRADMAHGRMMVRREQKADADIIDAFFQGCGGEIKRHAQSFQHF